MVVYGILAILFVSHDEEDGAWQFHDGDSTSSENARIVSLLQIVTIDPSIMDLADLPYGWEASRNSKDASWSRSKRLR
jgi:hypothetical protein